jgi:hypothetical protein
VTNTDVQGKRDLLVWVAVLLLTWGVAAMFNGEFIMGGPPTARGVLTTLVAVLVWPTAGWFAGSRSGSGFIRLATAFWVTVVVGVPLVFGALVLGLRLTVSQGGGVVLLLGYILAAPLYGLSALLPSWDSFVYEGLMWTVVIGAAAFTMTLGTYLLRRRIGRDTAEAAPKHGSEA